MRITDPRSALLVFGLFIAMLAGDFNVPALGFDLEVRAVTLTALALFAVVVPPSGERRPVGLVAGPVYAWAGWLALSALWSPSPAATDEAISLFWLVVTIALTVHIARTADRSALDLVWWLWVAAASIYLPLAVASGVDVQGRLSVPGGGPNIFVRVMVLGIIAAIFLAYRKRLHWAIMVPLVVGFSYGAIGSGSRGGLLGLALVVALSLIPLMRAMKGGTRLLAVIFGGGLGLVGWLLIKDSERFEPVMEFIRTRFMEQTFDEGYSSGRDEITPQAIQIAQDHPLFGAGLSAFDVLQWGEVVYAHPHNLFLSTAVDGGLIGLIFVALALGVLLAAALRPAPRRAEVWASLAAATVIGTSAMFSGYHYDSRLIWFFLILAVAYAVRRDDAAAPLAEPSPAAAARARLRAASR